MNEGFNAANDAILDTKPSVSELITRVGGCIFHKWQEFGEHLHIQPSLIEAVHKEELGRCESAFRSLCSKWLKEDNNPLTGDRPRTWRTVLDAVRKCREVGVAEDVEERLISDPPPPPYVPSLPTSRRSKILPVVVVLAGLFLSYIFGYHFPSQAQLKGTGLPPKPGVFVNREQEQFDIINTLTTSGPNHSRIVTVTGAPGHGKSALATVCGYTLHNMGIRVRHIDLRSARTEEDVIKYILDVLGATRSKSTLNELISKVKNEYSVVILILDNADYFTLSNEDIKDKFNDLMDLILENSHGIHIIITTQYKLEFVGNIRGHIPIHNLTECHSLEFINTYNPQIPHAQALSLVTYTNGMPIALTILSSLLQDLKGPSVEDILADLSSDPLHTLSPENFNRRLNKVFSIATDYLSENDRMCFVIITHFPSSFTLGTVSSILGHFSIDTGCLSHLKHRSLLEYNPNIKRYYILHLLRLHGYNLRGIFQRQEVFNQTFAQHYMSEALKKTSQRELFDYLSTQCSLCTTSHCS